MVFNAGKQGDCLNIQFLKAGHCTHPEFMIKPGGRWGACEFPSTVALINHPRHGYVLFDTGYTEAFYRATSRFPEKLYALITPVTIDSRQTAVHQLSKHDIAPEQINTVIISHFHADHVSGLVDFPNANYVFLDEAYQHVMSLGRFRSVKAGFLRDLLPHDFNKRASSVTINDAIQLSIQFAPFKSGWDLLGDGSLIGVALPGHARGHMGLFVNANDRPYFLIADACWRPEQFLNHAKINPLAYLVMDNKKQYLQSLELIHHFHKENEAIKIVACHCASMIDPWLES